MWLLLRCALRKGLHYKGVCAKTIAGNAVWTRSRAGEAGYEVDVRCDLCHSSPDTVLHRLWFCPACHSQREDVFEGFNEKFDLLPPPDLAAANNEDDFVLYTRGLFRHPGDVYPFPARGDVENTGLGIRWVPILVAYPSSCKVTSLWTAPVLCIM